MLSPSDALSANGVGTQDWLDALQGLVIVAYVMPLAVAGSASVRTGDLVVPLPWPGEASPWPRRQLGSWEGQVWISPDFDETDEDLLRAFEGEDPA